jgi:acyl carrier protein
LSDEPTSGESSPDAVGLLWRCVVSVVGRDLGSVPPSTPMAELGLDSISRIEVITEFEEALGRDLSVDTLERLIEAETVADVLAVVRTAYPGGGELAR